MSGHVSANSQAMERDTLVMCALVGQPPPTAWGALSMLSYMDELGVLELFHWRILDALTREAVEQRRAPNPFRANHAEP